MMFSKAEMFNRKASHPKYRANEIMKVLALSEGAVVADIGAGGGYFAMRFAETVGSEGKVYAIDTDRKLLAYIEKCAEKNRIANIETILTGERGVVLPEQSCDLIFLRNVFHHLRQPEDYFRSLKHFLRPKGRVAVIDYKKPRAVMRFISPIGHYAEERFIRETMRKAGYVLVESHDFLPEQSFNIFQAAENGK